MRDKACVRPIINMHYMHWIQSDKNLKEAYSKLTVNYYFRNKMLNKIHIDVPKYRTT